jgi:chromosomal replication initiator protein
MRAEAYSKLGDSEKALDEFRALTAFASNPPAKAAPEPTPIPRFNESALQLVKEYDFDHFVVGTTNNFAYATALSVARAPARAYNPLFVYGDVGLGKTHLVNAIANYMIAQNPATRIIYTNSEDFTGELIDAIQNNAVNEFRTRYKAVDLFIVDDIQFLAGKQRAQEEFFHIFNTLFQAKRQIVVTSDRPPKDISHLENRLLSRLKSGVIVDVAAPDFETRMAILNREIENEKLGIDPAISMLVAERMDTNIRELKGALNQIVAMRDLRGEEVTAESVRKLLDTFYVKV